MFSLRATYLDAADDVDKAGDAVSTTATPCDRQLARQLAPLRGALEGASIVEPEHNEDASYQIDFILNPKAWGMHPTTEASTIWIAKDPGPMGLALAREVEAAFVLGSWDLVDQFAVGVFGLTRFNALHESGPGGAMHYGPGGGKLIKVLDSRVAEERRPLWDAFVAARAQMVKRVIAYEALIESHAACRALREELLGCERAALDEARRYLSLANTSDKGVRAALSPTSNLTQALTGPDGRALMAAIRALAGPLQQLRAAQERYKKSLPPSAKEIATGTLWAALLGPLSFPLQIQRISRMAGAAPNPANERAAAAANMAQQSAAFQELYTGYAAAFPILSRVADYADEAATPLGEGPFTRRVVDALHDALVASAELAQVLAEEPQKVWRFPGLINRSLARGFSSELPFAQRVAGNRLLKENDTPLFARLNGGMQLLDSTLTLVPSPHVKVAMLLATVIGDTAELVESYFNTKEQRMGYRAAIDPARALGPDTSYASTLLQVAFLGLGLLPVKGVAKEWVEESASAAKARKLQQVALQGAM